MNNNLFAAVDLGSNSFHFILAKATDDHHLLPIDRIKETVRLGAGLDKFNNLDETSQLRALNALSRFGELMAGLKQSNVRVVGTSALRVANNANDFLMMANKTLGFNVEIISGQEEARLIYIGVTHSIEYTTDKRLVIDIGGGSTEFIIGSGYDPLVMESVTMGCISFMGQYFSDDKLNNYNFNHSIAEARGRIQTMKHLLVQQQWTSVIGSSGTAKTLYELVRSYDFHSITLKALYHLRELLISAKTIKKINLPNLREERIPIIASGLAIMIAIFEELEIDNMEVADGALREGVLYDLLGRSSNHDLRDITVSRLQKNYLIDNKQALRVANTASLIITKIENDKIDKNLLKLFHWATLLYEIGLSISHNDYHKHGAYILANIDMAGFSKSEQVFMSNLVLGHRGSLVRACRHIEVFDKKTKLYYLLMILSFRLAVIFNRNRLLLSSKLNLNIIRIRNNHFQLIVQKEWLRNNTLTDHSLQEEIMQWNKIDVNIELVTTVD
jgi:exopolyphosphatase/guanosine-5'-triphosphate,3'-diphosphate pyrophosphatase